MIPSLKNVLNFFNLSLKFYVNPHILITQRRLPISAGFVPVLHEFASLEVVPSRVCSSQYFRLRNGFQMAAA